MGLGLGVLLICFGCAAAACSGHTVCCMGRVEQAEFAGAIWSLCGAAAGVSGSAGTEMRQQACAGPRVHTDAGMISNAPHAIKSEMAVERTCCLRHQVRLALELVFEGLQAAGLPGGSIKSGGDGSEQNTAQHSLRIGDAVTVTLAAPAQPIVGAPPLGKQPAALAAKADGAAAPAAKLGASVQDGDGGDAAPQPPQHLLLEWQGGALPDMLADAVIAVLLQVLF